MLGNQGLKIERTDGEVYDAIFFRKEFSIGNADCIWNMGRFKVFRGTEINDNLVGSVNGLI